MELVIVLYIFTFVIGLFVGSFLNVVADRSLRDESFLKGRSYCETCQKVLGPKNLIPVFSFLFQGGKCSFCETRLSFWYPFAELISGLIFVFAAYYSRIFVSQTFSNILSFLFILIVLSFYLIVFLTDAKTHLIPDSIIFPAIFIAFVFVLLFVAIDLLEYYKVVQANPLGKYLIQTGFFTRQVVVVLKGLLTLLVSAFGIALFFLFLIFITKGRGMGEGDVRLGLLIGLFNGFPGNILGVFLGFVFGAVYSLVLIFFKKKGLKDTIAFGPFLIAGSVVSFIWGSAIFRWYFGLF